MGTASIDNGDLRIAGIARGDGVTNVHLQHKINDAMIVRVIDEIEILLAAWRNYWLPYLKDHASEESFRLAIIAMRWAALSACAILGWMCCYTWMEASKLPHNYHVTITAPDVTSGTVQTPLTDASMTRFLQDRIKYHKDAQQDQRLAAVERLAHGQN